MITSRTNITTTPTKFSIDLISGQVTINYTVQSTDGFNFSRSETVTMDTAYTADFHLQNQPKIDAMAKDIESFLADKVVPPSSDTTKPTKVIPSNPGIAVAVKTAVDAAITDLMSKNTVTPIVKP